MEKLARVMVMLIGGKSKASQKAGGRKRWSREYGFWTKGAAKLGGPNRLETKYIKSLRKIRRWQFISREDAQTWPAGDKVARPIFTG